MNKDLEKEIDDLLNALRLKPRDRWADEVGIPELAGRCAGSYGCATLTAEVRKDMTRQSRGTSAETPIESFVNELERLLGAGVFIENAIAALGRKYGEDPQFGKLLVPLVNAMRDPETSKETFVKLLGEVVEAFGDKKLTERVVKAALTGNLDRM